MLCSFGSEIERTTISDHRRSVNFRRPWAFARSVAMATERDQRMSMLESRPMGKTVIVPGGTISGSVELPGDKSISHRYAILAALAEGVSEIRNYSPAADCASTLECVRRLGIAVDAKGEHVRIAGKGLEGLQSPRRIIDAENSGSTIRMMSGVLAGQNFTSTITGDSSLRRRPMRRVVDPLRQMG